MTFRAICILSAFLLAPVPDVGPEAEVAQDAKNIQGTWELVDAVRHGKSVIQEAPPGAKIVFAGDKMNLMEGQKVDKSFTFKLDQTKKPKAIDITKEEGAPKVETNLGIYQLDGDRLMLCLPNHTTKDRPTEFASPENSDLMLFTLKRAAK